MAYFVPSLKDYHLNMKKDINVDLVFLKVLQILTQDSTPSSDLISTVKRLYETKFRVCIAVKIIVNFSPMIRLFVSFSYLCWFSIAGCYNSCSIIVFAFQTGGYNDIFVLLPFNLYSCLVSFKMKLFCHLYVVYCSGL